MRPKIPDRWTPQGTAYQKCAAKGPGANRGRKEFLCLCLFLVIVPNEKNQLAKEIGKFGTVFVITHIFYIPKDNGIQAIIALYIVNPASPWEELRLNMFMALKTRNGR